MRDDSAEILSRYFNLLDKRTEQLARLLLREEDLAYVIRTRPDDTDTALDECGLVIDNIMAIDCEAAACLDSLSRLAGVPVEDLERMVNADSPDAGRRWRETRDGMNRIADRIRTLRGESIKMLEREQARVKKDEEELRRLRELGERFGL